MKTSLISPVFTSTARHLLVLGSLAALIGPPSLMAAPSMEPVALGSLMTTKGRKFISAVVTGVEPDGIKLRHADGAAKVKFTDLPTDLQTKFGYEPGKAQSFEAEEQKKRQERIDQDKRISEAKEQEEAELDFKSLQKSFLDSMVLGGDLMKVRERMLKAIADYEMLGKTAWVEVLKRDLELLEKRIAHAPSLNLQDQNRRLEAELAQLRLQLKQSMTDIDAARRQPRTIVIPQEVRVPVPVEVPVHIPVPVPVQMPTPAPYCPPTPSYTPPHTHIPSAPASGGSGGGMPGFNGNAGPGFNGNAGPGFGGNAGPGFSR